jgi:hypothetical protein
MRLRIDEARAIIGSIWLLPLIAHPTRKFFDNFIKPLSGDLSMRGWNLTRLAKVIEILTGNNVRNFELIRAKAFL